MRIFAAMVFITVSICAVAGLASLALVYVAYEFGGVAAFVAFVLVVALGATMFVTIEEKL